MPMNLYSKNNQATHLFRIFTLSKLIIDAIGIIISLISLMSVISILSSLVKDKSNIGNEPYLIASLINLAICIYILIWASRSFILSFKETNRHDIPEPSGFDETNELERALVRRQISSTGTVTGTIIAKDKAFVRTFLFFIGFIILELIVIFFLPDELFWNVGITPDYFSIPLFFIGILGGAAVLRWRSLCLRNRGETSKMKVFEVTKLLRGKANPSMFAPEIEKALLPAQQNGKPNIIYSPDSDETEKIFQNSGRVKKKLIIETQPKNVPYKPNPIIYLYLLYSVIMSINGFLFLTESPPDNISVFSVPTIAIDYLWTIVKGIVLVIASRGLLKAVSLVFKISQFESAISYIHIESERINDNEDIEEAGEVSILNRSDYHFKVFTTKLLTETDPATEKRHIIKMSLEEDSVKMKNLIIDVIETLVR